MNTWTNHENRTFRSISLFSFRGAMSPYASFISNPCHSSKSTHSRKDFKILISNACGVSERDGPRTNTFWALGTHLHKGRNARVFAGTADSLKLRDESLSSLLPVALVSHYFYGIATRLIYESIKIDVSTSFASDVRGENCSVVKKHFGTLGARLSAGVSVRALVRNVHFFGQEVVNLEFVELLKSWISKFSQLHSLSWNVDGRFPTTLLKILDHRWPKIHLHVRTIFYMDKKEWETLTRAPDMLRSLHVCMPEDTGDESTPIAKAAKQNLFRVLNKCRCLRSLGTYVSGSQSGYRINAFGSWVDVKLESPLPRISEISIADKTFERKDLLTWGSNGGWARLKKITLLEHHLLDGFDGCDQSLRSIHLIDATVGYENALNRMCSRATRLIELRIRSTIDQLPLTTLKNYGDSLKILGLHPYGFSTAPRMNKEDISLTSLKCVQDHCPKLIEFSTNLDSPLESPASVQPRRRLGPLLTILIYRTISPLLENSLVWSNWHYTSAPRIQWKEASVV